MPETQAVRTTAAIRLLGRFEVFVDGEPVEDAAWRGRKAQQLVKLLAVSAGRTLHREQIADALWPDLDADSADRQLHKAIHAARRAFEPALASGADSAFVTTRDRSVALSFEVAIDADTAEASAEAALASRDIEATAEALALFSGALLPSDLYESWSDARRARLAGLHARLLGAVADGASASGKMERAADAASRLLGLDAADERAHRVLMQVAASSGDRSAIVRQFRACESALESELGLAPSEATRRLFDRLVDGSPPGAPGAQQQLASVATPSPGEARALDEVTVTSVPARKGWIRRVAIVGACLLGSAVTLFAVPGLGSVLWGTPAARAEVTAVSGTIPWPFVRVALGSSESNWSAYSASDGRFVLRDTSIHAGDSVTFVVETDGTVGRAMELRVPASDAPGPVELGKVDVAALVEISETALRNSRRTVPFDRENLEWYSGVVAAVTTGCTSDQERVVALHSFVAGRYARPADNRAVETPRSTIEAGTLFSGPLPVAFATLAHAANYDTRLVDISGPEPGALEHTVVEVFYDGRWHLFDPAFGIVAINDFGEVANLEDLVRHPSLVDRMPYAEAVRPGWSGPEIPALLRSGVHRVTRFRDVPR